MIFGFLTYLIPYSKRKHERILAEVKEKYRRDFLTRKQIEALPIKKVSSEEAYDLMCNPKLVTPICYAVVDLVPLKKEVGYTKEARYVQK